MARVTGVSPVLLVADIDRSVAYYRDRLGFTCETYGEPPNFASPLYLETTRSADFERAARRVVDSARALQEPERIVPNWRIVDQTWNVYIRVDDADVVYAEVQERGAAIDYTIYDAPHGFREFGVQDPDGHDIAFGTPL